MALGDPVSLFGQPGGIDATAAAPSGPSGSIFSNLNPGERQLLWLNILGGLSQGLAQANQPSHVKQSGLGFLSQALGGATQGAVGGYQQALQQRYMNQRSGLEQVQTMLAMQKAKQEADATAARNAAIAALPPDQQNLARIDPTALGKSIAAPSDLAKLTAERAALPPGDPRAAVYDAAISKATHFAPTPMTNVSMNIPQETEEQKVIGQSLGKGYSAIQDAATAANGKIARFQRLGDLLGKVDTGAFAGTTTDLKAAAKGAGIDLTSLGIADDVAPAQAARALSNQLALELRNPAGGAGMPGAMSDADRAFLMKSTPGLTLTPEGNKLLIDYQTRLAERDRQIAKLAADYRSQRRKAGGDFDEGFNAELANWSDAHPLFTADDVEKAQKAAGAAPAPTATAAPAPSTATVTPDAISKMTLDQLTKLDTATMSVDQLNAAAARYGALKNGGQ